MDARDRVRDELAALIDRVEPGLLGGLDEPDAHLRLVELTALVRDEAGDALLDSVTAARSAGASWDRIGDVLGVSRQAAQQRFGLPRSDAAAGIWRMTPVTSLDEMQRLAEAGLRGWHSIGFGTLYHDLVRDEQQWEHERVVAFTGRARGLEADGWRRIGTMWFPWAYYARPTGRPVIDVD